MTRSRNLHRLFPGIQKLLIDHHVELAYIFGSVAAGDARAESDVDLAILLPARLPLRRRLNVRFALQASLTQRYKRDFDVVILNEVGSLLFLFVVISDGRMIYRLNETIQSEFECKILAQYADFKPFLDQYEARYVAKNA
jgi:predicted nucleotidyltransferase